MEDQIIATRVPQEWADQPVLELFAERLPWLSKTRLRQLLHSGHLLRDGCRATPGEILREGELVELRLPEPPPSRPPVPDKALWPELLAMENGLLVLNKRPGVPTLSSRPEEPSTHSAALALVERRVGRARRLYPVHRLDRETSGLLLMALDTDSARQLSAAFEQRTARKTYQALVHGVPPEEGVIEAALGKAGRHGKMKVRQDDGKPATTSFRVLERFGPVAWIELEPRSGRTHQIRVHLAHAGFPIAGDSRYGGPELWLSKLKGKAYRKGKRPERPLIARVALHAAALTVPWKDGERRFEAPLPKDLTRCLKVLRKHGRKSGRR